MALCGVASVQASEPKGLSDEITWDHPKGNEAEGPTQK